MSTRKTSKAPHRKCSKENLGRLRRYLAFMKSLKDPRNIVFADEKSLKESDIYGKIRRDPFTGDIIHPTRNANSKNRCTVLAAVSVKKGLERNCDCLVIEEATGNAYVFKELFVMSLIESGFLEEGDIFVVDSTIHNTKDNDVLQGVLWKRMGILMRALPPYCQELNPTEFVFK